MFLVMVHGGLFAQLGDTYLKILEFEKHYLWFYTDSYHHDPDEEEGVANQNEKNRNFANIEVNPISLKESTVIDDIHGGAWIISEDPECNPNHHVDHRATWWSRTWSERHDDYDVGLTTAKHDEVLVLDRDKGQGELYSQEQVQPFQKHPVETGEVEEEGIDPAGAVNLVEQKKTKKNLPGKSDMKTPKE